MEWIVKKINKFSADKLAKLEKERIDTNMNITTVKAILNGTKITSSDVIQTVNKSNIEVEDKKLEKKVAQEIAKADPAKKIILDEVLGQKAIIKGIKDCVKLGQKDLREYLDNDVIKKILENKNFYKKYKKSLQIKDWIDNLLKIPMNDDKFSEKLGQSGSDIRDLLYKSKKYKLESWLAIFGPASKKDKTSKNINKINEALNKKLNRILKHLKRGFWDDYAEMTPDELRKLFGDAKSLYEFIKDTLKIDITILPLVLADFGNLISLNAKTLFQRILLKFIYAASNGKNNELPKEMYVNMKEYSKSPIQAAKKLRNRMRKVCSIDLSRIEGKGEGDENEENPELETSEAAMDGAKKFLAGVQTSIKDTKLKNNLINIDEIINQVQNNPKDEKQKQELLKEELELYQYLEDKENVEKLERQIQVKELINSTKEIFPNNKEINEQAKKLNKLMNDWDFSKDSPKS